MRKAGLIILVAVGALWGLQETADAFGHRVRTTCIAYYPGLYSFAPCGYGYPPYVFPCSYRYPKFCGHRRACWNGYLSCASCGYGACNSCASYGYGCGYGACGSYGGCGMGCGGYGMSCGGCGDCGLGCGGCSMGGCGGCDGGCSGGYAMSGGCSGCDSGTVYNGPTTFETDSKTIYDGPAPGPEPAATPEPTEGDPMASTRQIGFRMTSAAKRDGTGAYTRGLRSYWDGNMNEALRSFDAAAAAEPDNALYRYYRALAFYGLQGPQAANPWLAEAVALERETPVKNWGWQMERVQGQARLWVEQARRDAGLGR